MNYEQRYKEALERAKHYTWYSTNRNDTAEPIKNAVEVIFPELKESEDERIRKELISFFTKRDEFTKSEPFDGLSNKQIIAWLKKQGETNTEDFGEFINELSKQFPEVSFAKLSRIAVRVKKWLEKQVEQKPAFCHHEVDLSECSEEYRKAYYDGWNNCNQQYVQLEAEQKPWSEEDEKFLNYAISLTDDAQIKNFLKSIKERVQPQPKQEWSEYDKIQLSEAIQMIEANGTWIRSEDAVKKVSNWLKSLKPQNHWKPSEEQMQALFEAKLASTKNREYFLGLLYEDLKKL